MRDIKEAPVSAATPQGAGTNPCTDYITIPLEEYKRLLEANTELDIIRELAGDQNIHRVLVKATPDSMVPLAEYQGLQNAMAEKIADLKQELMQKGDHIADLELQIKARPAGHTCSTCGRQFFEEPAISRRDPEKRICSVCATAEALEDAQAAGAMSKGEADVVMEVVKEVSNKKEDEEVVPRQSTPEQCSRGGRKAQQRKRIDLPMDEIRELKAQGWSNVRIAKKYGVADVTIGARLKEADETAKAEKCELTVEDLRRLRKDGWTYEKIEAKYGIPEEKIREMLREAGRAKKEGSSEDK